jgi:N-acetylmuramoyl-L-alanine amidase
MGSICSPCSPRSPKNAVTPGTVARIVLTMWVVRALLVSMSLLVVTIVTLAEASLLTVSRAGRTYVDADNLATHLKAKMEATPERVYLRTKTHVVTLTRDWARVEIDGMPVVLEAPVLVEGRRWLVPEAFVRQVIPILEGKAALPTARMASAPSPKLPSAPLAPPGTGSAPVVGQSGVASTGQTVPPVSAPLQPVPVAPSRSVPATAPTVRSPAPAATLPPGQSVGTVPPVSAPLQPVPVAPFPSQPAAAPVVRAPGAAPTQSSGPSAVTGAPSSRTYPPAPGSTAELAAVPSAPPAPAVVMPPLVEAPVARPGPAPSPTLNAVAPRFGPPATSPLSGAEGLARVQARATAIVLSDVRLRSYPTFTRVVLETSAAVRHRVESTTPKEMRIRLDSVSTSPRIDEIHDGLLAEVRLDPAGEDAIVRVKFTATAAEPKVSTLSDPPRLLLDFPRPSESGARTGPVAVTPLRTIVLDAGHGGHDPGAHGPTALQEKELVLDVTRRVAKLVEASLPGLKVLLSRKGDYFVPLRERTSFANRERADLFVSIHANAHREAASEGVETYFLSSEATDNAARQVAAAENSVVQLEKPVFKGSRADAVKAILWDLAQSEFQQESSRLAEVVQDSMTESLRIPNRGVKQAGFYVLGGAAMPAVLIEIGFVTNPKEERRLKDTKYRDEIARAIAAGIGDYKRELDQRAARAAAR